MLLRNFDKTKQLYEEAGFTGDPTKSHTGAAPARSRHCAARFINVLFSHRFATRLSEMDTSVGRIALDERSVDGRSILWQDVRETFVPDSPEFDKLVTKHHYMDGVDPTVVVQHQAVKLSAI